MAETNVGASWAQYKREFYCTIQILNDMSLLAPSQFVLVHEVGLFILSTAAVKVQSLIKCFAQYDYR